MRGNLIKPCRQIVCRQDIFLFRVGNDIIFFSPTSMEKIAEINLDCVDGIRAVEFGPDERSLYSIGKNGMIFIHKRIDGGPSYSSLFSTHVGNSIASIHNIAGLTESSTFDVKEAVSTCVAVNRTKTAKIVGFSDSRVVIYGQTPEPVVVFTEHCHPINAVAWSNDLEYFASASSDNTVKLWDARQLKLIMTLTFHQCDVTAVSFDPTSNYLASGDCKGNVHLVHVRSGKCINTFTGHTDAITQIAFDPISNRFISSGRDSIISLWDMFNPSVPLATCKAYDDSPVSSVDFIRNTIVSSGIDNSIIKVWKVKPGDIWPLPICQTGLFSKWAVAGDANCRLVVWDTEKGEYGRELERPPGNPIVTAIAISHQYIAVAYSDVHPNRRSITIWEPTPQSDIIQKGIISFEDTDEYVTALAFSPDGRYLFMSNNHFKLVGIFIENMHRQFSIGGINSRISSIAFNLYGDMCAVCTVDGTVVLIDCMSFTLIHAHRVSQRLTSISFSPDGLELLVAGFDGYVQTWNPHSPFNAIHTFNMSRPVHLRQAVFTPDGKMIMALGNDSTIERWDEAKNHYGPFYEPGSPFTFISFLKDGAPIYGMRNGLMKK